MPTMRRIYQHFPERPAGESLMPMGYLEEFPDGSRKIHLDCLPVAASSGTRQLIVLPTPGVVQALDPAPTVTAAELTAARRMAPPPAGSPGSGG
jgi:hypothetical protein